MKSTLAIFFLHNQLAAWRLGSTHAPQRLLVEGQKLLPLSTHPKEQLVQACADIAERLRGDGFAVDAVHWVLAGEHQTQSEQLLAERTRLQQENEQLRSQNAALHSVDAEKLLSFLPALFPRVFTVLGATDLALLSGRVEPLSIGSPYDEPSAEALYTLQKRFRALPQQRQKEIVGFVAHLPQRQKLQPRPEMRKLVNELEES